MSICAPQNLLFLNPNSNMCRQRQVGTEPFHELMTSMKSSIALCHFKKKFPSLSFSFFNQTQGLSFRSSTFQTSLCSASLSFFIVWEMPHKIQMGAHFFCKVGDSQVWKGRKEKTKPDCRSGSQTDQLEQATHGN